MNQSEYKKFGRRTNENFCIQNWRSYDIVNNNYNDWTPNSIQLSQNDNIRHLKDHLDKDLVTQVFTQNNILMNSAYKFQNDQNAYMKAYQKITKGQALSYRPYEQYFPKNDNNQTPKKRQIPAKNLGQFASQMERALNLDAQSKNNFFKKSIKKY